jgi:hypothetical protein
VKQVIEISIPPTTSLTPDKAKIAAGGVSLGGTDALDIVIQVTRLVLGQTWPLTLERKIVFALCRAENAAVCAGQKSEIFLILILGPDRGIIKLA